MNSNRNIMLLIVVAAVAVSAGLWFGQRQLGGSAAAPNVTLEAGLLYPTARDIPPFALERARGGSFTEKDWQGHWTLAFFGFTHCPDICPTTLATLKQVDEAISTAPLAQPLQLLFVSVDPARDDAATLKRYSEFFSPRIVAATAPEDRLLPFTRQFGIVYMQSPLEGGGYTVDHSAQVVVIDPKGRLVAMFRPPLDAARITADLRRLAEGA